MFHCLTTCIHMITHILHSLILHVLTTFAFQILCSMNVFNFIKIKREQSFNPT